MLVKKVGAGSEIVSQHLYLEAEKAWLQKLLEKLCQKKKREFYFKMSILAHNLRLFVIFITTLIV